MGANEKFEATVGPLPEVWAEYADGTRYENLPTVLTAWDEHGSRIFEVVLPRDDEDPVMMGPETFPPGIALMVHYPSERRGH